MWTVLLGKNGDEDDDQDTERFSSGRHRDNDDRDALGGLCADPFPPAFGPAGLRRAILSAPGRISGVPQLRLLQ